MTTPRIEEMVEELINQIYDYEDTRGNIEIKLKQALTEAHQAGYADGYKQAKFDAEMTAEYGEPEVLQDNK